MLVRYVVLLLLTVAAGLGTARADDDPARRVIERFSATLIEVMKEGAPLGYGGRAAKLAPAVDQAYDMAAMTRAILGTAAANMSPADLERLTAAFTRFSVASYAAQFDNWNGETIEVDSSRPSSDGKLVVPSKIVPRQGAPVEIDYVLHQQGSRWGIVDVLLAGTVSQVAMRRSEFVSIFRRDGLDGLIASLDAKTAAMAPK